MFPPIQIGKGFVEHAVKVELDDAMDPPNDVDFAIESAVESSYPPYHNVAVESRERFSPTSRCCSRSGLSSNSMLQW